MKVTLTAAFVVAAALGSQANAAVVVHPGAPGAIAATGGIELAQYRHHYGPGPVVVRPGIVRPVPRPYYRRWVRRPYFGTVIAGVALGTILTAAAIGAPPPPPAEPLLVLGRTVAHAWLLGLLPIGGTPTCQDCRAPRKRGIQ